MMLRCATVERQGRGRSGLDAGWRADRTRSTFRPARPHVTMQPMIDRDELIDAISGFRLFSDMSSPQLEAVVHIFDERMFAEGETVVHQGLSGSGFFVIVDGEALVRSDGRDLARLGRGDFFGEVAILLGEPAIADVIALRQMRCLVLPGNQVEHFLVGHPRVMYRMLQAQARRLRAANRAGT
jgi:CRP-like cAMP-binding protein